MRTLRDKKTYGIGDRNKRQRARETVTLTSEPPRKKRKGFAGKPCLYPDAHQLHFEIQTTTLGRL